MQPNQVYVFSGCSSKSLNMLCGNIHCHNTKSTNLVRNVIFPNKCTAVNLPGAEDGMPY
jgi:hypothetical protein